MTDSSRGEQRARVRLTHQRISHGQVNTDSHTRGFAKRRNVFLPARELVLGCRWNDVPQMQLSRPRDAHNTPTHLRIEWTLCFDPLRFP